MAIWALFMFGALFMLLLLGFPVALTLGTTALIFGSLFLGADFFHFLPFRIWGIMTNFTLLAVPLFIFMGIVLEQSGMATRLLESMGRLFGQLRGGLAISVVIVGALLAATTGVVGASVVTLAVIALPAMLKHGYLPTLASGTVAASGTLGQIMPPSIILILLGDIMGVPVGDLFLAAVIPSLLLVGAYLVYIIVIAWRHPDYAPAIVTHPSYHHSLLRDIFTSLLPPLLLIVTVLGAIFFGIASPTESAAIGALGAIVMALLSGQLNLKQLNHAMQKTTRLTSMVFLILIGATAFGLVFVGMGGDKLMLAFFSEMPGGEWRFLLFSLLLIFLLGFFLDFIEICFIIIPILAPIALHLSINPLWFAILIALNLQTSFLTPPFGFSLFYLKSSAKQLSLATIYRGVVPFITIQLVVLSLVFFFPSTTLWLVQWGTH